MSTATPNRQTRPFYNILPLVQFLFLWVVGADRQMYPNAGPSTLLHRFFKLMAGWNWPNAIQLVQPYDAELGLEVGGMKKGCLYLLYVRVRCHMRSLVYGGGWEEIDWLVGSCSDSTRGTVVVWTPARRARRRLVCDQAGVFTTRRPGVLDLLAWPWTRWNRGWHARRQIAR